MFKPGDNIIVCSAIIPLLNGKEGTITGIYNDDWYAVMIEGQEYLLNLNEMKKGEKIIDMNNKVIIFG